MNSEELEQSLRTEFESYLENVVAGMRQEVADFRKMVESEFEKHKSQIDDAFRAFDGRFGSDKALDEAFTETVAEHLRLARDEGARITATAIAEAEELDKQNAAAADSSAVVGEIRDAIKEISSKTTQSAILKSLVAHAAQFTPRGAFFIIKNEHLVGWRVFGNEANSDDKTVREVFFPVSSDTLLGDAVRGLTTAEGAAGKHSDDALYLHRLEFGHPDRMFAIPLVVRERAVAVLYADYGTEGQNVNVEALEALVQVAGLTVEISASARSGRSEKESEATPVHSEHEVSAPVFETHTAAPEPVQTFEPSESAQSFEPAEPSYTPAFTYSEPAYSEPEPEVEQEVEQEDAYSIPEMTETAESFDFESTSTYDAGEFDSTSDFSYTAPVEEPVAEFETSAAEEFVAPEFERFETPKYEIPDEPVEYTTSSNDYEFESVSTSSPVEFESSPQPFSTGSFETAPSFEVESFEPTNVPVAEPEPEPVMAAVPKPRTRLSERNVDLPIEVNDDERRLHNDARRFARLLVSEIKLYNEQKVKEGRESSDLYEKLKEAIDRSREMYDKRVQPPVAAKFDYFHYELVSNLAEGDEAKLGIAYPGSGV